MACTTPTFLSFVLFTCCVLQPVCAGVCMSNALINVKLAAYTIRSLAYGIPRNAVWCVNRAVREEPRQHIVIGSRVIECISSERLTQVIGTSLPSCVTRYEKSVTKQVQPNGTRLVSTTARRQLRDWDGKPVSQKETLPFVSRGACAHASNAAIYQWCNSGCHYCCSVKGNNLPGSPWAACFQRINCPPRLRVCY